MSIVADPLSALELREGMRQDLLVRVGSPMVVLAGVIVAASRL